MVEKRNKRELNKGLCSIHEKGSQLFTLFLSKLHLGLPYLVMTMIGTYKVCHDVVVEVALTKVHSTVENTNGMMLIHPCRACREWISTIARIIFYSVFPVHPLSLYALQDAGIAFL